MSAQHVVVPLIEGVHSSVYALTLRRSAEIGGIRCRVLLPGPRPSGHVTAGNRLTPPFDEHHSEDPSWPSVDWGVVNDSTAATIYAVGLILVDSTILPGEELVGFDRAVGKWKQLLRDWLSVIADGPTVFLGNLHGETVWESVDYDHELLGANYLAGGIYEPQRVSAWEWQHALVHANSGDEPPLARTLLTTAMRAEATGDWRLGVIDAATAAEVALTAGLSARLSAEASSQVVQALIDRTRMLGPRLDLAKDLRMMLPARIQSDLVQPRNAVVHRGTKVNSSHAAAAIAAARSIVDEYEPLDACCQEPFDDDWEPLPDA